MLIKPFNAGMGKADNADAIKDSPCDMPDLNDFNYNNDIFDEGEVDVLEDKDKEDNGEGNCKILNEEEHLLLLSDTLTVCEMITKMCVIISV